jgi:hypothetical protein
LDRSLPRWKNQIEHFGQVAAVERREAGAHWTDSQVFEALLRAVLSNSTNWEKVETVLPELREVFSGFSLRDYADVADADVATRLIPWFKSRKAGSMTLARSLKDLARAARLLQDWSDIHKGAESYFLKVIATCDNDPKRAAVALGTPGTPEKLPSLGVPIAAEALRNLGFDICKPDRHICRAVAAFGFVSFRVWPDRGGTTPPQATNEEMLHTMEAIEKFAREAGERVSFIDNAIWLLCARMGVYASNSELAALAQLAQAV